MIIVTGGAGFIGSVLMAELNRLGFDDIILVDRIGEGEKWKNLLGLKYQEYFQADEFFQACELEEMLEQTDFIFHLGACSSTTEKDMEYLMRNNVHFSKNLLAAAAEAKVPILYASSAATYGDGSQGYKDDHDVIGGLRPLNPYGYSKQLVDEWVLSHYDKFNRWYGVKFFNVFGPNEYHKAEMRSIVHKTFEQIKSTGKVKLFKSHREGFNDGEQMRDFVYVRDVVKAMCAFMLNEEAPNGIYNLGSGAANSFKAVAESCFKAMDVKTQIEYIDMPESLRNQYQYFTQASMDKFHRVFPEFKFMTVEQAVEDYISNFLIKDNPYYQI